LRNLSTDTGDANIVRAMISMGRSLQMRVAAKGVETPEQFAFLQEQCCPDGQGFYFNPPLDAEEFTELLGAK
jgi:EAL domain-containing protein (putative c-di-GMP-specific phosphodiesterase class I)